jgi:chromosome segregation ATPase
MPVMITIKDYAKQKGVSYEAIRKQIKRYDAELEGHLIKQNRFLMLDDEAVQFLDGKRSENPVIVYEQNKDEELEQLRQENKMLLIQMNTVQDQLGKVQQKLIAEMSTTKLLTQEKVQYLEYKAQSEQKELQLQDLAKARDAAQARADQQEAVLRLKEQQIGALTAAKETAAANLQEARSRIEEAEARAKAAEEETERLKKRSFWDRLFNR